MKPYTIGSHVLAALKEKRPIVALETALLTHGLPRPHNLETVLEMEAAVRSAWAVPCTVGVVAGKVTVGLAEQELEQLSRCASPLKIGLRELPYAVSAGRDGGTTAGATAYLARRFGIGVLATGGIGGVHRGAALSFDVSNDLAVLGNVPVTVVSSGPKAILDLGLTLEYLETAGVTVIGYRTDCLPAFYSRRSPFTLAYLLESPSQVAEMTLARDRLGLPGAVLVCNPVPEEAEIPWDELMALIRQAETELYKIKKTGSDVTPWMLDRLSVLSDGRTLRANLALLRENAGLGAAIARAVIEKGDQV
ncbi:MAG: pseudouridine-5'-phosphate glycosidase [Dethiobacter sp.]|nr:pseudouridine-5'-phosphate glycosidase [Dethiobacter sp.]MCL5982858.1 pseudouridine-5'-phosphate glycosidase [Bacillota bacterium]